MSYAKQQQEIDLAMMTRVLQMAECGRKSVSPNPMVACVIVQGDKIVGEGVHKRAGEPHAERLALQAAGELARGATAYVNLEPCCHQGRTPPCTDALIDAGVTRVVAAMLDPNPLVAGGGFELLSRAGIDVSHGVLENDARWLNRSFVTRMSESRPWVRLKVGATLDGRTADHNGVSQWITCDAARSDVHEQRARSCAVMTGIQTILTDDARLNVRGLATERQPLRVVMDTALQMPTTARVIGDDGKLIVMTSEKALVEKDERVSQLGALGVEIVGVDIGDDGRLDLRSAFAVLGKWQINEVLVEAGATLAGSLLAAELIDELLVYYGASVLGDGAHPMFSSTQPIEFDQRQHWQIENAEKIGNSVKLVAVSEATAKRFLRN